MYKIKTVSAYLYQMYIAEPESHYCPFPTATDFSRIFQLN